jgi:hypothetical protein
VAGSDEENRAGPNRAVQKSEGSVCTCHVGSTQPTAHAIKDVANIPSWHAILCDPGESDTDMFQTFDA